MSRCLEILAHASVLQHAQRRQSAGLAPIEVAFIALRTGTAAENGLDGHCGAVGADACKFMAGNHATPIFQVQQIRRTNSCRDDANEFTRSLGIIDFYYLDLRRSVAHCLHSGPLKLSMYT